MAREISDNVTRRRVLRAARRAPVDPYRAVLQTCGVHELRWITLRPPRDSAAAKVLPKWDERVELAAGPAGKSAEPPPPLQFNKVRTSVPGSADARQATAADRSARDSGMRGVSADVPPSQPTVFEAPAARVPASWIPVPPELEKRRRADLNNGFVRRARTKRQEDAGWSELMRGGRAFISREPNKHLLTRSAHWPSITTWQQLRDVLSQDVQGRAGMGR
ncbi:hypothetical protein CALCODRAFT_24372 [Calocera cornea HHB12733]|uniref:Uncharacterized protein n=1 Tax=Calocera cornea HHB12733 TaxID=1353952 RepID=A0A165J1R6_9BASI|nr:hypothetical protein CALCODRAFT_24372 [Calocera cornea HHB12733]